MEDSHIANVDLTPEVSIFAVFDGHGGKEVALFCQDQFCQQLLQNEHFKKEEYEVALRQTFLKMDEILLSNEGQSKLREYQGDNEYANSMAGCTANVALITKTKIYIANAGDARCVLFTKDGQIVPMSLDHKPD